MGYMKVIESSTTWTCPKTGSYKIICVAGGQGGATSGGTKASGGSTSFGDYLTASGTWGGMSSVTANGQKFSGRNGYTFLDYGVLNTTQRVTESHHCNMDTIGYGAGGSGYSPGGCGKLKMSIVTLNEGDTVKCTVGSGGSGDAAAGKPGVIVIQYQGDDGWASTTVEAVKKVTINMYAYGELVKTVTVDAGQQMSLTQLSNIKSDDVEHYGWTKTAGSTSRNYSPTTTIYPTSDMDLYAVFKYKVKDKQITDTLRQNGAATVEYDGTATVTIYASHTTYPTGSDGQPDYANPNTTYSSASTNTNGNAPYVSLNGKYMSFTGSGWTAAGSMSVKKGDIINIAANSPVTLTVTYPKLDYNYYYRSDV